MEYKNGIFNVNADIQYEIDSQTLYNQDLEPYIYKALDSYLQNKHFQSPLNENPTQNTQNHLYVNKFLDYHQQFDYSKSKTGIVIIDQDLLNKQRSVIGHVLKQIGSNILSGKSIMQVSFPIDIFEGQSMLQRVSSSFSYLPHFFNKASEMEMEDRDQLVINQMKQVLGFSCTTYSLNIEHRKPFNPILGETCQKVFVGTDIHMDLEQVTHHPPVSYFLISTSDNRFRAYGKFEVAAAQGMNSIKGSNYGFQNFEFPKSKTKFTFQPPQYRISGLLFGQREFNISQIGYLIDFQTWICSMFEFAPDDHKTRKQEYQSTNTYFKGQIFKATTKFMKKVNDSIVKKKYIDVVLKPKEDIDLKIGEFCGNWLDHFIFEDEKIWDFKQMQPHKMISNPIKLASDSFYRSDSFYFKLNDMQQAQKCKDNLEDIQRNDRNLRKQNQNKK